MLFKAHWLVLSFLASLLKHSDNVEELINVSKKRHNQTKGMVRLVIVT